MQNLETAPAGSPDPPVEPGDDDQYGGPEPDNAHFTGVVVRLNPNGSAPTDNPFYAEDMTRTSQTFRIVSPNPSGTGIPGQELSRMSLHLLLCVVRREGRSFRALQHRAGKEQHDCGERRTSHGQRSATAH
jgi:hypothetical protein